MNLWIRSQDKCRLVKPNRLHIKIDTRTQEGYIFESANSMRYGTYESKERALEVLDEIQKFIFELNIGNLNNGFVFEMPKE